MINKTAFTSSLTSKSCFQVPLHFIWPWFWQRAKTELAHSYIMSIPNWFWHRSISDMVLIHASILKPFQGFSTHVLTEHYLCKGYSIYPEEFVDGTQSGTRYYSHRRITSHYSSSETFFQHCRNTDNESRWLTVQIVHLFYVLMVMLSPYYSSKDTSPYLIFIPRTVG